MPQHRHFLFVSILLVISQDSDSKKPTNTPPIRILPGRLHLNADYYQECPNISTLALRISNTHVRTTKDNLIVVDADLNSTREILTITKAVLAIFNCPDRASGKCQLFQTWRFGKETCRIISMKNQLWSPFFQNINPRLRCPNPQGPMELRNGSVDTRIMETMPFPWDQYYWRVRIDMFDPSLFYCALAGVSASTKWLFNRYRVEDCSSNAAVYENSSDYNITCF